MAGTNGAANGVQTQTDAFASLALVALGSARSGKLDGSGLAKNAARAFGSLVFDEVVVDSQFSPEVALEPWAVGDGDPNTPPSSEGGLLGYVRPRVRLRKNGQDVATFAPGGEPNGNWMPNAVGGVSAIVSVTAFLLGHKKVATTAALVAAAGFGLGYMGRPKDGGS